MADKETIAHLKSMISSYTLSSPQSISLKNESSLSSQDKTDCESEPYDFDELYKKGHAKIERLLVVSRNSKEAEKR